MSDLLSRLRYSQMRAAEDFVVAGLPACLWADPAPKDVGQNCMPKGARHLMPMIRVACITLDGTTLTVPVKDLIHHIAALDDNSGDQEGDEIAYTLTFKTMLVRDYEALGEFDGF